jgi:hypothetical protein
VSSRNNQVRGTGVSGRRRLLGWAIAQRLVIAASFLVISGACTLGQDLSMRRSAKRYLGFDRNDYPGDDRLAALRTRFAFTGYWLNPPPGDSSNSWAGKRANLRADGFGFLVVYNGRLDAALVHKDAAGLGSADAATAIASATHEGFPSGTIIFLDQEEGGRLLPEQAAYLLAWVEAVSRSRYRPGVYCSGIEIGSGANRISTAEDILNRVHEKIVLWVANDQCPPSPGCATAAGAGSPAESGVAQTAVWQYALSPRRPQFTAKCGATYAGDGNCYAPGLPHDARSFLDLDIANSSDPSSGR